MITCQGRDYLSLINWVVLSSWGRYWLQMVHGWKQGWDVRKLVTPRHWWTEQGVDRNCYVHDTTWFIYWHSWNNVMLLKISLTSLVPSFHWLRSLNKHIRVSLNSIKGRWDVFRQRKSRWSSGITRHAHVPISTSECMGLHPIWGDPLWLIRVRM